MAVSWTPAEWEEKLTSKGEKSTKFIEQALAVLRLGNRLAEARACWIFGSYRSLDKFQKTYPKLIKLAKQANFDLDQAAQTLKITRFQVEQLLDISPTEQLLIESWHELCVIFLAAYKRLLYKIAKKLFAKYRPRTYTKDECLEMFNEIIIRAVRAYSNGKIKFQTYLWHVATHSYKRHLRRNRGGTERQVSAEIAYSCKQQEEIASGKRKTPEEIVKTLGLNQVQTSQLLASLNFRIMNEQDLPIELDKLLFQQKVAQNNLTDMLAIIEEVDLSPLERAAFEAQATIRDHFHNKKMIEVAYEFNVSHQAVSYAAVRANDTVRFRLNSYYSFAQRRSS
jgi:RNA polymerase sigma factor (sigma-70 family)